MDHYWIFLVGIALVGVCGGYLMGIMNSSVRRAQLAIGGFVTGAILMSGYIFAWIFGLAD